MVPVFFLLSAFLLYRPMIAYRSGGPDAPLARDFAKRRILRIYPAYWVALTVLAIIPGLTGVFSDKWWTFYSLTEYLHPVTESAVCEGQGYRCGLLQAWTLTVEMTFYVMLPFFAALTARLARRAGPSWLRFELILILLLAVVSLALNLLPLSLREQTWFAYSFAAHFDWLGTGLALAAVSAYYGSREAGLPAPLRIAASNPGICWAGAVALYFLTVVLFKPVPFTVADFTNLEFFAIHLMQCGIAILFVLPVVFGNPNRGAPRRVLANPVLLWLGLVSYGLYLWQVTIGIDLGFGGAEEGFAVVLAGTVAIALPLAAASYYLIERPLMRWKYRPFRRAR